MEILFILLTQVWWLEKKLNLKLFYKIGKNERILWTGIDTGIQRKQQGKKTRRINNFIEDKWAHSLIMKLFAQIC